MLQHRDPAALHVLVELAVFQVVVAELAALVGPAGGAPGGADQAEGVRVGDAALDRRRRRALELAIDHRRPRRAAGVGDLVGDADQVRAAGDGEGAHDAHAVAFPDEGNAQAVLAAGQHVVTLRLLGAEHRARARRGAALAGPGQAGGVELGGVLVEQFHRRRAGIAALRVLQQLRAQHLAAVDDQLERVGGDGDLGRSRGRRGGGGIGRCGRGRGGAGRRRGRQPLGAGHAAAAGIGRGRRRGGRHRGGRMVLGGLPLAPLHPQQGRHHQPGEDQENTGLVHGSRQSQPVAASGVEREEEGRAGAGRIVPPASGAGNAPARCSS
ncbi:hypothetical protein QE386_002760 [Pseudoxanthomonas winnipegensis]|nr:hypothetical protein [Pseudoxanthomonas winnipegensis]